MNTFAQNQALADSLELVYLKGNYAKQNQLKILKELAVHHTDPKKKLVFSEELIRTARALDSIDYVWQGLLERGNALRLKSDLQEALDSYFQAASLAIEKKLNRRLGTTYIAIADVYSIMGNHSNASSYYQNAIEILREENDSINLASALLNAGDEFFNHGELDSALLFFEESGAIFQAIDYEIGVAYNQGNIGLVYAAQSKNRRAERNINAAISTLEKLGDHYPICVYLTYMSDIYYEKGNIPAALDYAIRSLQLARRYQLKEQISDAHLKLSELYERAGNPAKALVHYKDYIVYRDSINNLESVQAMANLRTDFEVSKKQVEVDLLNQQKRTQKIIVIAAIITAALIALLALGLYGRNRYIRKTSRIIEREKNRSDSLLLNILPAETAKELKRFGKVKAKRFDSVTVLFTDFKDFTLFAENLSPEVLVQSVDYYFSKFDEIVGRYGLEKIKTVGDSYMCAGGLPDLSDDHAYQVLEAAFEMAAFVEQVRQDRKPKMPQFEMRIGISTGPVIAGVVGTKKFQYDIWGDSVNIASRMESQGEAGKINISHSTYELVKDRYHCTYRGEIQTKGKGLVKMYFAEKKI